MKDKYLFVSGMFRSGTTFLARLLNSHTNVVCASDPLRPMFNSYRYDMANSSYQSKHNRYDPLDDYFLSNVDLLSKILSSDFNVKINDAISNLEDTITNRASAFSGSWAESFKIKGDSNNYVQVIRDALEHVNNIYGESDNSPHWIAFKEVWSNEMMPAFLRSFSEAKGIIIVRDPRAVVASNRANPSKYPILFLARQWRKLTYLAKYVENQFPNQVYVVRYEDLIGNYSDTLAELLGFIGEEVQAQMLDSTSLRDGDNKQWQQNTSYSYQSNSMVDKRSLEKWKEVLSQQDVKAVELVCYDLMQQFGYVPEMEPTGLLNIKYNDLQRLTIEELSEWIKPFSFDQDEDRFANEIIKEKLRLSAILSNMPLNDYERLELQVWEK